MKVNAIDNKNSQVMQNRKRAKKDLTSFGIKKSNTPEEVYSKNAVQALKASSMSNVTFKGVTEERTARKYLGTDGCIEYFVIDYIETDPRIKNTSEIFEGRGRLLSLRKGEDYYPNSYMYSFSKNAKVYFADPQEVITNETYNTHAFVVLEHEPEFPSLEDIKSRYLDKIFQKSFRRTGRKSTQEVIIGHYPDYNDHTWLNSKTISRIYYGSSGSTMSECNFTENCKEIYDYHNRLRKADLEEILRLENRKKDIEKKYEESAKYKKYYEESFVPNAWGNIPEEKVKADYFFEENQKELYDVNQKLEYYKNRIGYSMEQQKVANELYTILIQAQNLLEQKDSLTKKQEECNSVFGFSYDSKKVNKLISQERSGLSKLEKDCCTTQSWLEIKQNEYNPDEDEIKSIERKIEQYEAQIQRQKSTIGKIEKAAIDYVESNKKFTVVIDELAKLFPKVEEFYAKNSSKIWRKWH